MDPLSNVPSLPKPRSSMSGGFAAGGPRFVQFPWNEGIKCYAVVTGRCWLSVEGVSDAARFNAEDCFLLPRGRPFRLASDVGLTPVDAATVHSTARDGGVASCNGGDFSLVDCKGWRSASACRGQPLP